jgi:hypothetical protein
MSEVTNTETPKPETQSNQSFSPEYVRELREESKAHRLRAVALENTVKEALTKAELAEKLVAETESKYRTESETKIAEFSNSANQRIIRAELKAQAVKAGMIDLDGLKLLDTSTITIDKNGDIVIPDGFFEDAKKAKSYLFATTGADTGTTTQTKLAPKPATGTKSVVEMTDEEYAIARAELTRVRR